MKFGAMNDPSKSVVDEVRLLGEFKFDFIDLTVEGPKALPRDLKRDLSRIKDVLSVYGLDVVGHTAWFLELAHPYEKVRRVFVEEALDALEVLAEIGACKVTYHPFLLTSSVYRREPYRSKLLESLVDSLKAVSRRGSDLGVQVVVENLDGGRMWSLEEYQVMVEEAEVGFHLDVGHANLDVKQLNLGVFLEAFPPRSKLLHVHVSDNFGGSARGGWDLHLPLGAGSIEWDKVFRRLMKAGYDGTVTLEVFSRDKDYLKMSLEKARSLVLRLG